MDTDQYYYERWAKQGYHQMRPDKIRNWNCISKQIKQFADLSSDNTILDFGCGRGIFIPLLARYGTIHAFDVTTSVLQEVQKLYPDVHIFCGNGSYPTQLGSETYSIVVSSEVIEHVEDQKSFIAEVFRVLKPYGLLVLTTPNGRWESSYKASKDNLQPIENWLTLTQLSSLVKETGLQVLKKGTMGAHWINMPYRKWWVYKMTKKITRAFIGSRWNAVQFAEDHLAGLLNRGIVLYLVAQKK